ncbi:MAG TPA: glycosyltransferase family 1 protein [Candidatus Angelobacter sp.]
MRIAFDSWVLASRFRYHGTYVYAQNLIREFRKMAALRPDLEFCLFTSPRNSNDAALFQPAAGFDLARTRWLGHDRLWRMGGATLAAAGARADLIFSPSGVVLPLGIVPVVCTIHDVTPVTMPFHSRSMMARLRLWLRVSSKRARSIITVSECSKRDLIQIYRIPESRVFVIYNGYDKTVFNDLPPDRDAQKRLLASLNLERPYILHHGTIQPRKNLKRLIDAYRLLLSKNRNLQFDLVLAGSWGWEYEDVLAAANNNGGSAGRVIFPGPLNDDELALLLKGADLVVMPSLYEGFCLPMVEAMACGVPVIAASTSCLPEVSGGVLQYFDPHSVEEMACCMEQVLEDQELRRKLVQDGKKRAAFFDWQRCAQQTIDVLMQNGSK